jgi:hypothetical protein
MVGNGARTPCAIRIMVDLLRFTFIFIHTIINIIRSFQGR